ncbi:MAG: carboxypeptidase-like regulatory domain-containing protein [Prevotella sp.]|uniref:carboxypeptidase-like regulatory domain-containing protein n=1 Tax=Prevotella sp. TaxID=59823 RepID=UPI002A25F5E0|nr:carboxypeptidase-like regulatory domain-containing protein [Prevotella sp.]MDD7318412.1 carboxypeptidase-like regulatory domain-containing protein [Prevotellaceae bacterium]MDY4020237.1 carboxypeptidase-like regulatory domain-containing protein [Prevotella sp.]
MEKTKTFLLSLLGLLVSIFATAQDDIVNDYKVDFNTPITTNSSANGSENRDFIVSAGWGHMVGMLETGFGSIPTYVPYTYNATGGVDDSGCLQAGAGSVYDSFQQDYFDIIDILVTPLVKGTVTIQMKKANTGGFVEFYTMQKNGDKWEKGLVITGTALVTPNTDNFVTYTLPELTKYTYVGIRMVHCYVDNFTATEANFKKMASLKVDDILPNSDITIDADAEGKFNVEFKTTVTNNGDFDLTTGTENYSVSLYKYNAGGGADKTDHQFVMTLPITENLAHNATSGELTLSATLNTGDYPTAVTNGISFRIYEDLTGTFKSTKTVKVVPYVPSIALQTKVGNSTKDYYNGEELYMGTSVEALSLEMMVNNAGGAPLQITGVTVPAGFSTTLVAQEIQAHGSAAFNISTTDGTGMKEGDFVIKSNAGDFTLKVKAMIAEAGKFFVNFESDDSSNGMIAERIEDGYFTYGWITNNTNEAGYPGNNRNAFLKTDASEKAKGPFKLITPQIELADGETFSFEAARYYTTNAELKVYYSDDRTNWNLVRTLSTDEGTAAEDMFSNEYAPKYGRAFLRYTINNIPAGKWYVAFEGGNNKQVFVDNILGGTKVDVPHDVSVKASVPETGTVNSKMLIQVRATNLLGRPENGEDYVIKVMFGDEVVKEMPGVKLPAGANTDINIDVTPHTAGTFNAVVKFVFADGNEAVSAETSVTIAEEMFVAEIEAGGPATVKSYYGPFGTYYKKSESQTIYLPTDFEGIAKGTKIKSITYRGYNTKTGNIEYDAQLWIGETTNDQYAVPYTPIDKNLLTKVFDGKVTLNQTAGSDANEVLVVFTFTEPYVYQGGNLVVNLRNVADTYNMSAGFGCSTSPTARSIRRGVDSSELDNAGWSLLSLSGYSTEPNYLPVAYLGIDAEAPTVSGVVTDKVSGQAIGGAEVKAASGDVMYSAKTDSEGKYSLNIMKPGYEYELVAHAEGYAPSKKMLSLSGGSIENNDIQLEVAKGLFIDTADIPQEGMVNFATKVKAKAANYTLNDFGAGSYTAKLYVDNKVVDEAEAVEVKKGESADFTFRFTPHAEGTFPAYIEFVQGENTTVSETKDIVIKPENAGGIIQVCDSTLKYNEAPLNLYYNNSAADIYYTPEMLEKYGVPVGGSINKIMYKLWSSSPKANVNFTVNAWVGKSEGSIKSMTAEEKTAAKETMTHALIDKTYENISPEGISPANPYLVEVEIDLSDNPIVNDGVSSVRLIVEKSASEYVNVNAFAYDNDYSTAYVGRNDYTAPEALGTTISTNTPVAYFFVAVGANVTGTVTDAVTTQPLAGASVKFKSGEVLYTGTTGDDGKYDIVVKQLQLEDYSLEVEATEDYELRNIFIGNVKTNPVNDVALRKAATISGTITSARDESAVSGATVTLLDAAGKVVATATTAEDGKYSFKVRMLDADYKITVTADKFADAEAELTAVAADVEKNIALETLAKRIYGVVRNEKTNEPISGVEMFYSINNVNSPSIYTGEDGKYEFIIENTTERFWLVAIKEGYLSERVNLLPLEKDREYDIYMEEENGPVSGIDSVSADELAGENVYDLSGRLVNSNGDTRNLKRGQVYIIKGKKVVLK